MTSLWEFLAVTPSTGWVKPGRILPGSATGGCAEGGLGSALCPSRSRGWERAGLSCAGALETLLVQEGEVRGQEYPEKLGK